MNISVKLRPTFVAFVASVLAACQGAPVHLGTDGPVYVKNTKAPLVEAKACGFQMLLVIPISNNTRHLRAWNSLRAQAYGKSLTNVQVEESWFWAGIGTIYCTKLSAAIGERAANAALHAMPAVAPIPEPAEIKVPVPAPVPVSTPEPVTTQVSAPAEVSASAPTPVVVSAPVAAKVVEPATPLESTPVMPTPRVEAVPAPTATRAASAAAVASPQADKQANAKDGAVLRTAPMLVSAGGKIVSIIPAGTPLVLKQKVSNGSGEWWFVIADSKKEGWVRAAELDQVSR